MSRPISDTDTLDHATTDAQLSQMGDGNHKSDGEPRRLKRWPEDEAEAEAIRVWQRQWLEENREAIQFWNEWVEKHGLPYAKYRQF